MIINRIYETQNLLSLWLVSFLFALRTYLHPCSYLDLSDKLQEDGKKLRSDELRNYKLLQILLGT